MASVSHTELLHHIIIKEFASLTETERAQCSLLTNAQEDSMFRTWLTSPVQAGKYAALVHARDRILGWAAATYVPRHHYYELGVFVAPEHRRKGLGGEAVTALVEHLIIIDQGCPALWYEADARNFYDSALHRFAGRFTRQSLRYLAPDCLF